MAWPIAPNDNQTQTGEIPRSRFGPKVSSMKPSENSVAERRREHAEQIVTTYVRALFERVPMLCGFSVRSDLEVADVAVSTWPGYGAGPELYDDVVRALEELVDERPDAVQLLRGRTFARAFH